MGAATQERNPPPLPSPPVLSPHLPSEGRHTGEVEGDADRKAIATRQKTRTSEKETWQISIRSQGISQGISLQRRG